jgi:hypothetical protein
MASKSKGKQRGEVLKQEDVIQAVVIADSFNIRFAPITKKKPKVKFTCIFVLLVRIKESKNLMQLISRITNPIINFS